MREPIPGSTEWLGLVACPACRSALAEAAGEGAAVSFRCSGCGNVYPVMDGIPILLLDRASKGT